MNAPYISALKRPRRLFSSPLMKNDTVIGTIGNTHGVSSAAKPHSTASIISAHIEPPSLCCSATTSAWDAGSVATGVSAVGSAVGSVGSASSLSVAAGCAATGCAGMSFVIGTDLGSVLGASEVGCSEVGCSAGSLVMAFFMRLEISRTLVGETGVVRSAAT